ncbi:MAG TPA: choice-of-anchor tandem repeat NxxGxxAF-containing protein [Haliangiales bacterium]|nr:choice-of-anchor tandem repeat NxxGxxAF-containing protein [Haliangiales bacterium]
MRPACLAVAFALSTLLSTAASHAADPSGVRRVAVTGQPAPGGGTFDRFSVESLPIVAPINGKGQVAFFATVLRGRASEGFFLSSGTQITKLAADGDPAPGGGVFSGFGRHPVPALNDAGELAFAAAIAGARAVEGIFVASRRGTKSIALAGAAAPDIPSGTFASVDAPALNERGEVAFLATVRRGRETLEAIYLNAGGKSRKIVAQGDPAPAGGVFAGFGPPALNGKGSVVFGAVVEGRAVPGGLFVGKSGAIRMLVGAGEDTPDGGIFAKFSERVAVNDAGLVAFNAILKGAPIPGAIYVVDDRVRRIAGLGDAAPGGGVFSHFGLWPSLSAAGAVVFAASVDGGASPVAVFVAGRGATARVSAVGDALPGGGTLVSFGLYPFAAASAAGAVTFAAAPDAVGAGAEGVFAVDPASGR